MKEDQILTPELVERFWAKVDKNGPITQPELGPCWLWKGSTNHFGYGNFSVHHEPSLAHRISWLIAGNDIPNGMCVLHKCDNPPCTNPDHLFLGTRIDNVADKVIKGHTKYTQHKPTTAQAEVRDALQTLDRANQPRSDKELQEALDATAQLILRVSIIRDALEELAQRRHQDKTEGENKIS